MSQFLSYIHNLRGIAILFVVGVHARGGGSDWFTHTSTHHFFASFFDAQEGNGTVMFIFIAGFLFQHLTHRYFDFNRYLTQKFKVIILPYLIISVPIILFRIHTNFQSASLPEDFHTYSPVYQFFYHLIIGSHMAPFWFITAIILFYLSAPLLHAIDRPFFYRYIFPFILLAGMFTYRSHHNANPLLAYLHFMPIYITGMWASYNKAKLFSSDLRYFWLLTAIYLTLSIADLSGAITLPERISFEEVLREEKLIFNIYILRALVLCFMLTMLLYKLQYIKMPFIELLGDYSFGIFFIHFMLITFSRKLLSVLAVPVDFSLITFLIYFIFILLTSTVTVYLIKKLTGRYSRNLIGS